MAAERAELADDAQHHGPRLHALELDLALAEIGLDTVELAEEIVVPERTAVFAVGDRLQPDRFLLLDDAFDLAVFDRLQLLGRDLAALALGAGVFQCRGAKKAADVVGAERRRGTLHFYSLVTCTILSVVMAGLVPAIHALDAK